MDDIDIMRQTAKASVAIESSGNALDVAAQAINVAKRFGFDSISLVEKKSGEDFGEVFFSTGDPSVVEDYRRKGLIKHDPLVNRTLDSDSARSGAEIASSRLSEIERRTMEHVAKTSGCANALVIPVRRSTNPSGVIVFGGAKPNTGPAARVALTILGHCTYGRIADLTLLADAAPARAKTTLSPRETEVLTWVSKGKCDSEIAIILSMSERTARFHVANAKAKLDTTSRVQAVTKAMELGLIAA